MGIDAGGDVRSEADCRTRVFLRGDGDAQVFRQSTAGGGAATLAPCCQRANREQQRGLRLIVLQTRRYDAAMDQQASTLASDRGIPPTPGMAAAGSVPVLVVLTLITGSAVAVVFWPTLNARADYFDDGMYLTENRLVQNPGWDSIGTFLREVWRPSTVSGYYQPLAMISLALDSAMGGSPTNYLPYRRTSLALHVLNAMLVAVFLYALFGNAWVAAAVALLFGVHPLMVEPVPWTGERKTLLAAFFALLCLVCYVYYARRRRWWLYGLSLVMLVLALLSKPTTTALPLLLLLLDFWPLRRLSGRALLEKVPFLLIAGFSAYVTVVSQQQAAAIVLPSARADVWHIPKMIGHNTVFYLYKLIWPAQLSSNYAVPQPFDLCDTMVLTGAIGSIALLVVAIVSLRWTRSIAMGLLFYFLALFPTMNVIGFTNVVASHKYVYLPIVGILVLVAFALGRVWQKLATVRPALAYAGLGVLVLVAGGAESALARQQLGYWRDTEGLYQYMLQYAPTDYGLQTGVGFAIFQAAQDPNLPRAQAQAQVERAIEHYRLALQDEPGYFIAHNNLGTALAALGRLDEALVEFGEVIRLKPDRAIGYAQAGRALHRMNRLDEAMQQYRQALEIDPYAFDAVSGLAAILAEQGKFADAEAQFRRALQIHPRHTNAQLGLGMCLLAQRKVGEAISVLDQAQRLAPDDPRVRKVLDAARGQLDARPAP